jgi:hypothetical protein
MLLIMCLMHKERGAWCLSSTAVFPLGQECVVSLAAPYCVFMLKSIKCAPRAAGCQEVLGAWSGRHEVTRTAIWETQYPLPTGSVFLLIQDMQWQIVGTRNQFNRAIQNRTFTRRETVSFPALNCTTLRGSCDSVSSVYTEVPRKRVCGILSFNIGLT